MYATESFDAEPLGESPRLQILALLAFSVLVSLWGLTSGPGLGDHEAIVAQGARQIRQGDGWLIPHVNDVPFVRKPPLAFWLAAAASIAVDPQVVQPPVSPFAARLPSAIAAVLTVLLVYVMGRSMFGHRIGLVCGAAMAVSGGTLFFSHNAQVEMMLTLFCTAAFTFFWLGTESRPQRRVFLALFYAGLALAMLAKAPLPLATVCLPLAIWWFLVIPIAGWNRGADGDARSESLPARVSRQLRSAGRLWIIPGLFVFCVIFVPWPVYVCLKIDNALDLWKIEFIDRYSGALDARVRPFWYYLPIAFALTFPFSLSLPEAFASPFKEVYRTQRKGLLFALTWAVVQIAFLSTSSFKRPHYLIGAAPAFALLLGPTLARLFLAARTFSIRTLRRTCVLIVVGALLALVAGGFFVVREHSQLLRAYCVAGTILALGVPACCVAFLKRQRALSLALLHVCAALAFVGMWDGIGQARALQWQAYAMVETLREKSIGPEDRITWVVGRPDARLVYYLGREIQPLFSPLDLAAQRTGRRAIPRELLMAGAERLERRLESNEEEYFIIDAEIWDKMRHSLAPRAREVFRVLGDEQFDDDDDWVVITNDWNTGEEEDFVVAAKGLPNGVMTVPDASNAPIPTLP